MTPLENICHFLLIFASVTHLWAIADKEIASKLKAEKIQKRCTYSLRKLWQTDISTFPFVATPLVADADGDGGIDIIAAPFGEALAVIEGETGQHLHDTSWPQHNLDKSVYSSPLQYDVDGNGVLDILFVTSQGEGMFYTGLGLALHRYNFQLQPAYVKSQWLSSMANVNSEKISSFVSQQQMADSVPVDPHVLSTPVLYNMKYLVIPVSFFFSDDEYDNDIGPWGSADAKNKFYVGAIAVIDLKDLQESRENVEQPDRTAHSFCKLFYLELSQSPVYNLFTPTLLDIDGEFGVIEIITGLSSGNLYILTLDGKIKPGFPRALSPISGRIAAADLNNIPGLELIVLDMLGNASCLDANTGKVMWSVGVGGSTFAGSQIVDVDLDGQLDVVIATDEGNVYALNGLNGTILPRYPFRAGKRIAGNVLVTKFNAIRGPMDLVFLSEDGILHMLAGDCSCLTQVALADSSLVDIILHNIMILNRGLEMIIATADGSLICLGSGLETPPEELVGDEFRLYTQRLAHPSSFTSSNNFYNNKVTVLIDASTRYLKEVTGSSLDLYFTIHGASRGEKLHIQVYMGSELVHQQISELESLWVKVRTPEQPGQAQVTVVVSDRHGFVCSDSVFLRFNQLILLDLQWLILAPFIAMVVILLVNHGFPAKDLLPITFPFKSK